MVRADKSGYVQCLDADAAEAGEVSVEVPFGPGSFLAVVPPAVKVWPMRELGDRREGKARDAILVGVERSFALRQLSDIALKGLSPGVNDPTASMRAMDRMGRRSSSPWARRKCPRGQA